MPFGKNTSVAAAIAPLQKMITKLEDVLGENLRQAQEHEAEAHRREELAVAARQEAEAAKTIVAKIRELVS